MNTPGRRGPRRGPLGAFGEHRSAQHEGLPVTMRKPASTATTPASATAAYAGIRDGIVELPQRARQAAARNITAPMTATYRKIGQCIAQAEQQGKRRADCGDVLIKHLASDLTAQLDRGFGWRNLFQMRAFYLARPNMLQAASADSAGTGEKTQKLQTAPSISATVPTTTPTLDTIANRFPLPWSAVSPFRPRVTLAEKVASAPDTRKNVRKAD